MPPRLAREAPRAFLFLLLFATLVQVPREAYDTGHDTSSHATFEYYAAHGFQFGRDVYQNTGPLGYVHYAYTYAGLLAGRKLVLQIALKMVFAALALWMAARMPRPARLFWLAALVLHGGLWSDQAHTQPYVFTSDIWPYLSLYLIALYVMEERSDQAHRWISLGLVLVLAFYSLSKHTLLMLSCLIVLSTALLKAFARDRTGAGRLLGLYAGSLVLLWIATGQALAHIPAFLRGIGEFSRGYNEAMSLDEPPAVGILGGLALVACAAAALFRAFQVRDRGALARLAVESALLYATWKHGFVRADEHVLLFFGFAAFFAMPLLFDGKRRPTWPTLAARAGAYGLLAALTVAGTAVAVQTVPVPAQIGYSLPEAARHVARNVGWLLSPQTHFAAMEARLSAHRERHALPGMRGAIGTARVDVFGFRPGYALLNGLRYAPRPMPITFAAASPSLMRRNEAFYRDRENAPEYVIAEHQAIDGRFPPQDDALALRALLDNYTPAAAERGLLLLRRNDALLPSSREEPLAQTRIGFGTGVSLTDWGRRFLWVRARVRHTWRGRLRAALYKPPRCLIDVRYEDAGPDERFRFITTMGEAGFLVAPVLRDNGTLLGLYGGDPGAQRWPSAFRFMYEPGQAGYFEPEIDLVIVAIPGPRAAVELARHQRSIPVTRG